MSKFSKKNDRFNKAQLEKAIAKSSLLIHRKVNQLPIAKRPTYDLGYVFDHLFWRKRNDEAEMVEESMFVPKIDIGHKISVEERRREERIREVTQRYLDNFGTNLIDHSSLYSACLRAIARNFYCYDVQELEEVMTFLPPAYCQAFHYYCAIHNTLDDTNFEHTVMASIDTILFPSTVSGNSIEIVSKKLLSIRKLQEEHLDWEELENLEIIDNRESISQILFFGTELSTFHFQRIALNFANLQFLHFVRVNLYHNDMHSWADNSLEEAEGFHEATITSTFADTRFRSLKEVTFVCCTFVDNEFLSNLSTKILENFISLQLIKVFTSNYEMDDISAKEKQILINKFAKYNVEISFVTTDKF